MPTEEDDVQLTLHIHHETERAFLASTDGERKNAKWLPKSQIGDVEEKGSNLIEVTVPHWLAYKAELI